MAHVTPVEAESESLTLHDLARLWGVSYTTVYAHARRNALPVPVVRVGRQYRVSRKAIDAVMSERHAQNADDAA